MGRLNMRTDKIQKRRFKKVKSEANGPWRKKTAIERVSGKNQGWRNRNEIWYDPNNQQGQLEPLNTQNSRPWEAEFWGHVHTACAEERTPVKPKLLFIAGVFNWVDFTHNSSPRLHSYLVQRQQSHAWSEKCSALTVYRYPYSILSLVQIGWVYSLFHTKLS